MADDPKKTDDEDDDDDDDDDIPAVVDDDDDDEDEDDDDEDEEDDMTSTRSGGGSRGGSSGGRGTDDSPDFASSPMFSKRFLSNLLHIVVSNWGEKAGDARFINDLIKDVEDLIGPTMIGGLSALAAAGINNPTVVKGWLRSVGVPEDVIALSDEAIDAFINGVLRRRDSKGKVTEKDLEDEANQSRKKAQDKAGETITLAQGIAMLSVADQKKFRDNYTALDADSRKLFDAYRGRIRLTRLEMKNFLAALCASPDWIDQLRMMYGDIKPMSSAASDAVSGVIKTVVGVVKDLDNTVVKAIAPPASGPDPVVREMRRVNKWLKKRR